MADRKQARKKKRKKKKSKITLSENVSIASIGEHVSSSDIPRLPRSPAEISVNWRQLIQVKSLLVLNMALIDRLAVALNVSSNC